MKKSISLFTALIICSASIISGCKKEDENIPVPDPQLENLFGAWKLISSSGGDNFQVNTPATLGYTPSIEFKKNGQVLKYKNDKLSGKDRFSFKYNSSRYASKTNYTVEFKDDFSSWIYISNDTLHLDNAFCNDCWSYIYVRK